MDLLFGFAQGPGMVFLLRRPNTEPKGTPLEGPVPLRYKQSGFPSIVQVHDITKLNGP